MENKSKIYNIHAALAPKLNLAFYQNSVPVLRELAVINDGEKPLKNVELGLISDPAFIKPKNWRIEVVDAGQHYRITNLDLALDGGLLGRLTEAETAQSSFALKAEGEIIARLDKQIELLPRNQWGGIGHMPELIAAFVQPNEPAIDRLLKKAAEILRKHGKSSMLNGYQGGAKRAWELAAAIWAAIGSMGLDYSLPPANFERAGQKVRNPGQIADVAIATCMDITLLSCAALEQCGLNPLVVFTRGHAVAGVWLKSEEFTTVVVDDITALRKREKLKELILFETTLVTHRPCPSFKHAVEVGARHISEDKEEDFELAIDIQRARLQRIKPLASEQAAKPSFQVSETKEALEPVFEEAPDLPDDEIVRKKDAKSSEPRDRLDSWQRKLLDLTLRNSLLNFRTTKRAVKLDAPDPGKVEDLLADGHVLKILSRPDLMDGTDLRSQAIYEDRTNEDVRRAHALDALNRKELMASLPKDELNSRLVELYRFARANLQEGGANTLFLALGFLSWTRDEKEKKRYRAPLILVPVILQRRSVRSGFTLRIHDDESRFNPTLIEMLQQDFSIELGVTMGELPRDVHGLDIAGIWNAVSQAIKDIRGWEVVEDLVISTFSFAKYLMWKDLVDRTDQLKQNRVVKHLIENPLEPYVSEVGFVDPHTLDQTYSPEQVFCPLSADSSQLSAVISAAKGKDFVLKGPPGTGKSQTIANLIANCLAKQKTVLFVSEKMAALNVVYRRLCEIKLGDFSLELHSNKARKLDVLQQLGRAWDAKGPVDAKEWRREAQRLKTLRDELNKFVKQLHLRRRNGLTAYIAIGRTVAGGEMPQLYLSWPSADIHSEGDLFELEELADKIDINAQQVGAIAESPLTHISHGEWSPSWQQSLVKAARVLISAIDSLEKFAAAFFQVTGLSSFPLDGSRREGLARLCLALPQAAGRDWRFALSPDARSIGEQLREGLDLLKRYEEVKSCLSAPWPADLITRIKQGLELIERHRGITSQLSAPYSEKAFDLDVVQLRNDWDKAEKSWWPFNRFRHRRVRSTMAEVIESEHSPELPSDLDRLINLRHLETEISVLSDLPQKTSNLWAGLETQTDLMGDAIRFQTALSMLVTGQACREVGIDAVAAGRCGAEMATDLDRMRSLQSLERDIARLEHLRRKSGGLWAGLNSSIEELEKTLNFQQELSSAIGSIAKTAESLSEIKQPLERLLGDGNALLEPTGAVAGTGNAYCEALEYFRSSCESFSALIGSSDSKKENELYDSPVKMRELCDGILQLEPKLRSWCSWRKVRGEAIALGLKPLVDAIENESIALGRVKVCFKTDYARWWLNATVDSDDILRTFVSAEHEKRIADFKALDDRVTDLTRDYIRAGICANLPDQDDSRKNSEWGILRHEMQKKKRHMPLRELINSIPSTITKLAPCLLMSPLSIAQYLSTETPMFDIVVFDEASQIPVWDAIGAIARGKQVVMVGDPKQLPPTSFFDRAESETDYEEVERDLESILDECIGANLPTLNLSWHYRSRHESLITFSNSRYYDGGLVTFPSPSTEDRAVSLHFISNGVYEKGGARINKPEARALVDHIVSRLKDKEFNARGMSIGVVTFNSEQQRLIEDLLDSERRKSPAIESFFADERIESVFVKNLESVQGDERDIMYFSLTYGPDAGGSISMNFGPMNRDGGERRLNVAITRARHELLVFSSLRPEQIDLSRTPAIGVRDLKHFMEYAERGPKAIAEAVYGTISDYDSPFEEAVAKALANRGWQVHPQVGVSSFRIDIGIVDPDASGRYLAGVECDGATYHRSATARDRDKLREHVLKGLGWQIIRIWSTDWWIDAAGTLEKVHANLSKLLAESRAQRAEEERKRLEAAKAVKSTDSRGQEPHGSEIVDYIIPSEKRHPADGINESPTTQTDFEPETEAIPDLADPVTDLEHVGAYQDAYTQPKLPFTPPSLHCNFSDYNSYEGPPFRDPRNAESMEIAEGLCSIIEVEGPMLVKRAYDIYLRGCGIKRMGRELKRTMNKALQHAVRQRRVVIENELNTKGYIHAIVRITGTSQIILRKRGPRSFEEIPPSEILVASHLALKECSFHKGSDEHLHAILELLDLKRLTTQTGTRLLEIIDLKIGYGPE